MSTNTAIEQHVPPLRCAWLLPFFLFLSAGTALCQPSPRQALSVNEKKIKFHLFPETQLEVALVNHAMYALHGTLLVELIGDAGAKVLIRHEQDFDVDPGQHSVEVAFDRNDPLIEDLRRMGGYLLRYTIKASRTDAFQAVQGTIQMGPHILDGFTVQAYPGGEFPCPLDCRFLVRVSEPNSGRGLSG